MNRCIKCGGETGRRREWIEGYEGWVCKNCNGVSGVIQGERYYNLTANSGVFWVPLGCLFVLECKEEKG